MALAVGGYVLGQTRHLCTVELIPCACSLISILHVLVYAVGCWAFASARTTAAG